MIVSSVIEMWGILAPSAPHIIRLLLANSLFNSSLWSSPQCGPVKPAQQEISHQPFSGLIAQSWGGEVNYGQHRKLVHTPATMPQHA